MNNVISVQYILVWSNPLSILNAHPTAKKKIAEKHIYLLRFEFRLIIITYGCMIENNYYIFRNVQNHREMTAKLNDCYVKGEQRKSEHQLVTVLSSIHQK